MTQRADSGSRPCASFKRAADGLYTAYCDRCGFSREAHDHWDEWETDYPLPNAVKRPGDLCPKSFAGQPQNHVRPAEAKGWGVCLDCGEVVNIRGHEIPEHRIPAQIDGSER